jgi:signal transduction histidine kinase
LCAQADIVQHDLDRLRGADALRAGQGMRRLRAGLQETLLAFTDVSDQAAEHEDPSASEQQVSTDLVGLLRSTEPGLRERAAGNELQVVTDETALTGRLNPLVVARLLDELVGVAAERQSEGGEITVLLRRAVGLGGIWAVLTVRDRATATATGAPARLRGKAASPDSSSSHASLATARALAERQGGTLDAVSVPGMGNSVTVRLPLN